MASALCVLDPDSDPSVDPVMRALARKLPRGSVSVAHADRLAASVDLWPRHVIRLEHGAVQPLPRGVVWPTCVEDVQTVVMHAREHGISVVPYSAGSSVVGGASPQPEQLVVDFKRLSQVQHIDVVQRMATAQVGIMGETWERTLQRAGVTQGQFPSSIYCSTLGGWIGARSAGQMSSRYGKIEDQLLGGVVVLGDGRIVRHAPSPVRGPLLDSLVGAEGMLGLWVEATVRVHPLPHAHRFCAFDFPDLPSALHAAERWLHVGIVPSVVRIYDPLDSYLHRGTHAAQAPHDRGPNWLAFFGANFPKWVNRISRIVAGQCRCIVMLEGTASQHDTPATMAQSTALLAWEHAQVLAIASAYGAHDLGPGPGQHWYDRRHAVSYRQSNAYRAGVTVDTMEVACTWDRVLPVYEAVRQAGLAIGVQVLAHFSHMYRDGASIYFTYAMPLRRGERGYAQLWQTCLDAAITAGANVSHHHGVGKLKAMHLDKAAGPGTERIRHQWQSQVDPDQICNPYVLSTRHGVPNTPLGIYYGAADVHARVQRTAMLGEPSSVTPLDHGRVTVRGELCAAPPHMLLHQVEAALCASGLTLGWVAKLLPDWSIAAACRMGWLWRTHPQLRVIESLLAGVDGDAGDHAHYDFVPAPRAAQGPELLRQALAHAPKRLWLRAQPLRGVMATLRVTEGAACLHRVHALAHHGSTSVLPVYAHLRADGTGVVHVGLSDGERRTVEQQALDAILPAQCVVSPMSDIDCPHIDPTAASGWLAFAGTWQALKPFVDQVNADTFIVCTDPIGAMGFVHAVAADMARVHALAEQRGVLLGTEHVQNVNTDHDHTQQQHGGHGPTDVVLGQSWSSLCASTPSKPLSLDVHHHHAALDNCTYCPKLCRFSCPTADAAGEEAITPRQLMHTTNMHVRQQTALSRDTAWRLFSCVDCRGCQSFCDHGNDVAHVLQETRSALIHQGHVPDPVRAVIASFQADGCMPDRPHHDHPSTWVPPSSSITGGAHGNTRLFLGCQGSVQDPEPIASAWALTRQRFGADNVSVVQGGLCCGHPLWRWGARDAFRAQAQQVALSLRGAERIIVDDPGCAYTFNTLYRQMGIALPAVHTLRSLIDTPMLTASSQCTPLDPRWAPHDACFSSRWLHEPTLRSQAAQAGASLAPGSVVEGQSGCCGGMLLPLYDAALAQRTVEKRVEDLLGGGAQRIVAASPTCRRRLRTVTDRVDDWTRLLINQSCG